MDRGAWSLLNREYAVWQGDNRYPRSQEDPESEKNNDLLCGKMRLACTAQY